MTPADLYVRNGRIVTATRDLIGGVVISDGRVREVVEGNPTIATDEVIDATGLLVMPGLVDAHVHFSEPGRGHWEGFATGSRAAAAGGITTFVEMPLNVRAPSRASWPSPSFARKSNCRSIARPGIIRQWNGQSRSRLKSDMHRQLSRARNSKAAGP